MDVEEMIISFTAIVCAVGLPILLLIVLVVKVTQARHEERMAMIEKGIILEEPEKKTNKFVPLRNGLLMIGLATGALLGVYLDVVVPSAWTGFPVVIFTVLGGGLAFLLYFFVLLQLKNKEKE